MKAILTVGLLALAGCNADGTPQQWVGSALDGFVRGLNGPSVPSSQPVRSSYEVTCVTRDRSDPGGRIDALGGPYFHETLDNVIQAVEGGTVLYTKVQGRNATLEVVTQSYPRLKYLRTSADGYGPNNLLSLPECR